MTSPREQRIVVTGLGATTPLGGTVSSTWEAVLAGRSGARDIAADWVAKYELPVTFAATIHTKPADVLTKVETRRLDPGSPTGPDPRRARTRPAYAAPSTTPRPGPSRAELP